MPKFQDRVWLHVLMFVLTVASTTLAGAEHYAGFLTDFSSSGRLPLPAAALLVRGLWYSATILAILGFKVFDWITPRIDIQRELAEKHNVAVAIVCAAIILGISYVVASVVQ